MTNISSQQLFGTLIDDTFVHSNHVLNGVSCSIIRNLNWASQFDGKQVGIKYISCNKLYNKVNGDDIVDINDIISHVNDIDVYEVDVEVDDGQITFRHFYTGTPLGFTSTSQTSNTSGVWITITPDELLKRTDCITKQAS